MFKVKFSFVAILWAVTALMSGCGIVKVDTERNLLAHPIDVTPAQPANFTVSIANTEPKRLLLELTNHGEYADLSIWANKTLLSDKLNVPASGAQSMNTIVQFDAVGEIELRFVSRHANLTIDSLSLEDTNDLVIPSFENVTDQAGIEAVNSIKYGGPTIADMDQDGDYDIIVNNHNAETSKLYWNNGDGTFSKHRQNLARWFMHDLHGTAAGDYDNDGDLDLIVTQGGGNGTNPSKANFYLNDNGNLVRFTGDVGITLGGRGRGARWSDFDLDGDLDIILINERGLTARSPQHFFYENLGNGKFSHRSVQGIEDVHPSRVVVTELNNDGIDDIIFYSPLSVWQGNGDFTFTNITAKFPQSVIGRDQVMAIADIDIDNDGDFDLYLARGKAFEGGEGETPSFDHDPLSETLSIKPRGFVGRDAFEFIADGVVKFHNYYYLSQGAFRGKPYPIYLGASKSSVDLKPGEELTLFAADAEGWPDETSENGVYFGYLGNDLWRAELVRNGNLFWGYQFSLSGVAQVEANFVPQNRNESDILLRNDGNQFSDVSHAWNIPKGGNALGVTRGDFNSDGFDDLFVYRWGDIAARISDMLLLNRDGSRFEMITMHGADDIGGAGNGDMGQAFDYDLDGAVDLLNGAEHGQWSLFKNSNDQPSNFAIVRVGYAPQSNVDALSAEVVLKTTNRTFRKRVGSAGAIFSQSFHNNVHFGLGREETIESIDVKWRNGESVSFSNKDANQVFETDKLDPVHLEIASAPTEIRKGTNLTLSVTTSPEDANSDVKWSTSNPLILDVDPKGVVSVQGEIGQTATISAKSTATGFLATHELSIIAWESWPASSLSLELEDKSMLVGDKKQLRTEFQPEFADPVGLDWQSSDPSIASVDQSGIVTALAEGVVTISATAKEIGDVRGSIDLVVVADQSPFIRIRGLEDYANKPLIIGDQITVMADYHAGTDNQVIFADEGGVRFWLRHFRSKWIPVRDIVLTDESALYTAEGTAQQTFSLGGLTPTADLPEGHFYQLRASFTSSDGTTYDSEIYPLSIVAPDMVE